MEYHSRWDRNHPHRGYGPCDCGLLYRYRNRNDDRTIFSMITYKSGNILISEAQCLVNPVNVVGVMGAGLALQYKRKFPAMFSMYKKMCDKGDLKIGTLGFWRAGESTFPIVCMFPTKRHFREASTLKIIESGLAQFVTNIPLIGITSVAFPMLGCGLGGLCFEYQVQPLMEKYLNDCDLDVFIYI